MAYRRAVTPADQQTLLGFFAAGQRGGRNEVEIIADVWMDQVLARQFANETQLGSLGLAMDPANNAGACTGPAPDDRPVR